MLKNLNHSELIGMHSGDGTLYKTKWSIVWELRGGLNEKDYYDNHVKKLLESIFQDSFFPKFRSGGKNGCYGIQTSKKIVTNFFLNFGFKPCPKSHSVFIPSYIKKSNIKVKRRYIRGLFDTDGCIRFQRINNNIKYTYPRIEFGFASIALRNDLFCLLKELGFRVHKWGKNNYKLATNGNLFAKKFFDEIKPMNKKHLKRYEFWFKYKYYNAAVA